MATPLIPHRFHGGIALIDANPQPEPARHGLERCLRQLSGARALTVVDGAGHRVEEHSHDWPVLSLFVAGQYHNRTESGERTINVPSAVFYRRGDAHANLTSDLGFEQVEIEFDPTWLRIDLKGKGPWHRIGGRAGRAAKRLAGIWSDPGVNEEQLLASTRGFFRVAFASSDPPTPCWVKDVAEQLQSDDPPLTHHLARDLGLSCSWVTEAYRTAMGEGIVEAVRRRRVEKAAILVRETEATFAQVAAGAGFCDQSHMIRAFKSVLGRTPSAVRAEWVERRALL